MADGFADRLLAAIDEKKTPLIVGLDPVYDQLPPAVREHRDFNDPSSAAACADAFVTFCNKIIKIVAPLVPAVKINSAFFERYFWFGQEAYAEVVAEARANGLIVIGDVKRSDIGHSAEQYAAATLREPRFDDVPGDATPDAVTVNPYLGADGVQPFVEVAQHENRGVFVLVRTSNPSAAVIQDRVDASGEPLYLQMAKLVDEWGAGVRGASGFSSIGAVVGATHPEQMKALRKAFPKMLFLVPGFGTQGGGGTEIAAAFDGAGRGAVINASRSILQAWKKSPHEDWQKSIEAATREAIATIRAALPP
jgi:orotidine-5'-phosphate decarboxylase